MTKVTRLTLDDDGELHHRRIHLREVSVEAERPLETVGQDLRTARLRRGDELADVSRALKIRKDHLEAIEEDRIEALPGRTYAIGFVRSYAEYLGLDSAQCLARFKSEIAGREHEQPTVSVIDDDDHRRLPQGWKIIAGVVILVLAYGAYHLARSADEMLTQPVASVPPQIAPHPVAMAQPRPAPIVVQPQTVQPQTVQPQTVAPAIAPAPDATAPAAPVAAPQAGTSAQVQPAPAPAAVEQPLPAGRVYGQQNRNARVILRAHQPTRILVQDARGTVYINRTLQPGDTFMVPNTVGLTVTTPNAGAIEVQLDGSSMGYIGRDQQIGEALSLDPQAIVDRHNNGRTG